VIGIAALENEFGIVNKSNL